MVTVSDAPGRSRRAAVLRAVERGRERFEASVLGRWWGALLDVHFVDRAVALAAKAFVAFLPALLTVAALAPDRVQASLASGLQRRLGLSGDSLEIVKSSLATGDPVSGSTGALGVVLLLFYATTFTSALQRVYLSAWHLSTARDRVKELKGLAWLAGVIAAVSFFSALGRALAGLVGTPVLVLLGCSAMVSLWWITGFVMLRGQVRWRVLLPPAVATGFAMGVYVAAASVWVPRSMTTNQEQFGFLGVSMTLVSWFVGVGFVVVVTTALGPVLATDDGLVGRVVRGREGTLWRGRPPGEGYGPEVSQAGPRRDRAPWVET